MWAVAKPCNTLQKVAPIYKSCPPQIRGKGTLRFGLYVPQVSLVSSVFTLLSGRAPGAHHTPVLPVAVVRVTTPTAAAFVRHQEHKPWLCGVLLYLAASVADLPLVDYVLLLQPGSSHQDPPLLEGGYRQGAQV